jgi:predicted dehydrogenase
VKTAPIRWGLVGTGYWAQETHAKAIAEAAGIELRAIWGRSPEGVSAAASRYEVDGILDFDEFLAAVDAVSFAVPPDVQSGLALRAINAGKHVLLEKPIATTLADADALVSAAEEHEVASLTFFNPLFDPRMRAIVDQVAGDPGWSGAHGVWLGSALRDDNPFNTPWRHIKGGLWDLGPHAVAVLWATLGPITSVTADPGRGDLVHLTFHHESGASSTTTLTLHASEKADGFSTELWGELGRIQLPVDDVDDHAAMIVALHELAENIADGRTAHSCDVRFGREVVRVLERAGQAIDVIKAAGE